MTPQPTPEQLNEWAITRLMELDGQLSVFFGATSVASMIVSGAAILWMFKLMQSSKDRIEESVRRDDARAFVRTCMVRRAALLLLFAPMMFAVGAGQIALGSQHPSLTTLYTSLMVAGFAASLLTLFVGASLLNESFSSDDGFLSGRLAKRFLKDFDRRRQNLQSPPTRTGAQLA